MKMSNVRAFQRELEEMGVSPKSVEQRIAEAVAREREKAQKTHRELVCPVCSTEFEDPDPSREYPHGIICSVCTSDAAKGVIHPRVVRAWITQDEWDRANARIQELEMHVEELKTAVAAERERYVALVEHTIKWDRAGSMPALRTEKAQSRWRALLEPIAAAIRAGPEEDEQVRGKVE